MTQKKIPQNFRQAEPAPLKGPSKNGTPVSSFPDVGMTLRSYQSNALTSNLHPARPATTVVKTSFWHRFRSIFKLKRIVLSLLLIVVLGGGWLGYKFIYNAHKIFGGSIFSILTTTKLRGESSGRVNILLAGNSADDPGHDGADLTDSIMLVSIDTQDNTAFLLSIPRDLYVNIPGAGYQKINDAYVVGQNDNFSQSGYFSGGMGQLEQIVEQDFGINIDYYALINYAALKDAVDDVGGITINIQSSDPRGLYDPSIDYATHGPLVRLTNGEHTLDGEQALDLARARGDAYGAYGFDASDFERTQNQRLMLVALKNKLTTASVIANPTKLTDLADTIGSNVSTDFNLSEVHRLYDISKGLNSSNIASLSLSSADGKDLVMSYQTSDGQDALAPTAGLDDYQDIQSYMDQITSPNPVVREGATVVVLNGTSANGLALSEKTTLENDGFNVVEVADAASSQATTTVIDNSSGKYPSSRSGLEKVFGNNFTTTNPYSNDYNANFIVVLGQNSVPASTTTNSPNQ